MECLREISDFIEDLGAFNVDDPIVEILPSIERHTTMLLHKLRHEIDRFDTERRDKYRRNVSQTMNVRIPPKYDTAMIKNAPPNLDWFAHRNRYDRSKDTPASRASPNSGAKQATCARKNRIALAVPQITRQPSAQETRIYVSSKMYLPCKEVANIADATTEGELYYFRAKNRFIIKIAGVRFIGNIGNVYNTSEAHPPKIRDCQRDDCDIERCPFYHNPLLCDNSADVRNFIDRSWLYEPRASAADICVQNISAADQLRLQSKKIRKLSSRISLDMDMATINEEDLAYYSEQMMHDLLCLLLMSYYVRRDSSTGLLS